jgi:pSer/pThr/pTyr-binding forkhead associated (FHA) protein
MPPHIEVWRSSGVEQVALDHERVTVGRDPANLVCIADDDAISAMHAVFERYSSGWSVRDLGSRNGTFVNRGRITGERSLHSGDVIEIGDTQLVFRDLESRGRAGGTRVTAVIAQPELTRRERDVLQALCRPLSSAEPFKQPASIKAIASELVVTEAAVKQHLLHLYAKFNLNDPTENRRLLLANAAIQRGVLRPDELGQA